MTDVAAVAPPPPPPPPPQITEGQEKVTQDASNVVATESGQAEPQTDPSKVQVTSDDAALNEAAAKPLPETPKKDGSSKSLPRWKDRLSVSLPKFERPSRKDSSTEKAEKEPEAQPSASEPAKTQENIETDAQQPPTEDRAPKSKSTEASSGDKIDKPAATDASTPAKPLSIRVFEAASEYIRSAFRPPAKQTPSKKPQEPSPAAGKEAKTERDQVKTSETPTKNATNGHQTNDNQTAEPTTPTSPAKALFHTMKEKAVVFKVTLNAEIKKREEKLNQKLPSDQKKPSATEANTTAEDGKSPSEALAQAAENKTSGHDGANCESPRKWFLRSVFEERERKTEEVSAAAAPDAADKQDTSKAQSSATHSATTNFANLDEKVTKAAGVVLARLSMRKPKSPRAKEPAAKEGGDKAETAAAATPPVNDEGEKKACETENAIKDKIETNAVVAQEASKEPAPEGTAVKTAEAPAATSEADAAKADEKQVETK